MKKSKDITEIGQKILSDMIKIWQKYEFNEKRKIRENKIRRIINEKKNKIYDNWKILAPDGELLSLELKKRADWYIDRNLAELTGEKTIKLKFEPKSRKSRNDLYDLSVKENKCVCCGTTNLNILTKHHIVPSEYRKLFPIEIKSRNSHDIVAICRDCHDEYENNFANIRRQFISDKYNIPLNKKYNIKLKCCSIGKLLLNKDIKLPKERYNELFSNFCKISKISNPDDKDILEYIKKYENWSEQTHAELVMKHVLDNDELFDFVKMWRKDFIDTMKPKYMPKYWSIDRKLNI